MSGLHSESIRGSVENSSEKRKGNPIQNDLGFITFSNQGKEGGHLVSNLPIGQTIAKDLLKGKVISHKILTGGEGELS